MGGHLLGVITEGVGRETEAVRPGPPPKSLKPVVAPERSPMTQTLERGWGEEPLPV